jgi:3-methyladenine DNA glycosylase AlkC
MADRLKDSLYPPASLRALGAALKRAEPGFDEAAFLARIFDDGWESRALTVRTRHVTAVMHDLLPADYRTALDVLLRAEPEVAELGWPLMSLSDYVATYGVHDWQASLPALERLTQHMSAEFAVRPFLRADTDRMLAQMLLWAEHPHPGVRRLASEGSRLRLPWGRSVPQLTDRPELVLPILERLRGDPDDAVRLSVANSLNDIAKVRPELVLDLAARWLGDGVDRRLLAHALRTLVKAGDSRALGLLGYGRGAAVEVDDLTVTPPVVSVGGRVTVRFVLRNAGAAHETVLVDLAVHRPGRTAKPLVFRALRGSLAPGEILTVVRRRSFAQLSTRTYQAGEHRIEVTVNGTVRAHSSVLLTTA